MADNVTENLDKLNKSIEKTTSDFSKEFKGLINNIKETNRPLAEAVADLRSTQKGTFAGALAASKLLKMQTDIKNLGDASYRDAQGRFKKGAAKIGEYFDKNSSYLKDMFKDVEGFDTARDFFAALQTTQSTYEQQQDEIINLEKERADVEKKNMSALLKIKEDLAQAEINLAREESQENKDNLAKLKKRLDSKNKTLFKALDTELEIRKAEFEETTTKLEELNSVVIKQTEEYSKTLEGFQDWSDGFKDLTGIDIVGMLNSVTSKLDSIGKLFRIEDLSGKLIRGVRDFIAHPIESIKKGYAGVINAVKSLPSLGLKIANGIGNTLASIGGVIAKGVDATVLGIQKSWSFVKEKSKALATATGDMIGKAGSAIKSGAATVAKGAANMIKAAASFLAASFTALMSGLMFLAPYLLIGLAIVALVGALVYGAMWLEEKTGIFSGLFETVKSYFTNIIEAIGRIFGGFYDFFAGLFTGDFDRMFGGLKDILGGLWDLIKAPFTAIGDFFKNVFGIDIGQILVDFAKKVLPDWVLKWLGWGGGEDSAPNMQNTDDPGSEENARELTQAQNQAEWERRRREGNRRELGGRREGFMGIGSETDEEYQQRLARENENRDLLKGEILLKRSAELERVGDNEEMRAAITARYDEMFANVDAGVDLNRISRQVGFRPIDGFQRDFANADSDQIRDAIDPLQAAPGINPTELEIQEAAGRGSEVGQATQDVADAQADVNMQVNTVQQNTNNVSNSSTVHASTGRTRNNDATANRVAAVPA